MAPLLFLPIILLCVAIWASLESIRPEQKDRSITPLIAALAWLVALSSVLVIYLLSLAK